MQTLLIFLAIILMITKFSDCEAEETPIGHFGFKHYLYGVDIIKGEMSEEGEEDGFQYERYRQGLNWLGQESFFLLEDDLRIGKIMAVRRPTPSFNEKKEVQDDKEMSLSAPTSDFKDVYFYYRSGMTTVCEGD